MVFAWRTGWWLTSVLINTPGSCSLCSSGGADVLLDAMEGLVAVALQRAAASRKRT